MKPTNLNKKKFAKGLISSLIVESQHPDPERALNTVSAIISSRRLTKSNKPIKKR